MLFIYKKTKELAELDKNTVRYMMDEMQAEMQAMMKQKDEVISQGEAELEEGRKRIEDLESLLEIKQ